MSEERGTTHEEYIIQYSEDSMTKVHKNTSAQDYKEKRNDYTGNDGALQ